MSVGAVSAESVSGRAAPAGAASVVGRRRYAASALAALLLGGALALLPAAAASAHDYLVTSDPAAGSTVRAAPRAVTLTFNATVLSYGLGSTALQVRGPGDSTRHWETGCAVVDGRTVTARVALGGAGIYTETWRVVSADGHPVSDSIRFTYAPPAGQRPAVGSARGPDCGVAAAAPGATAGAPGALLVALVIAGGLVILGVLAAVVIVVLRATRIPEPANSADAADAADPAGSADAADTADSADAADDADPAVRVGSTDSAGESAVPGESP